jgi:diguanylate cyclase
MDQFRKRCAAESVAAEGHTLTVTLSVGLSETSGDQAVGPLVRRADEALYAAKGTGRNRTYYHDGTKPTLVGAPEALSQQK